MESHPLNLAHQQHRRAEAHLINNRYDDAMQCHHNAAELLLDAMKSTASSVALESITLQHSYHLKQKDLIKSKKEQYARVKKAMDNLKGLAKDPLLHLQVNEHSKIQVALYRALNETDSLLSVLSGMRYNFVEPSLLTDFDRDVTDGKKIEKSQHAVLDELHLASQNMHTLVGQMVLQVEVLKDENMTLKEIVNYLEKERAKYLNLPSTNSDLTYKNNFSTTDGTSREATVTIPQSRPINATAERQSQQPHFDLSALKDD